MFVIPKVALKQVSQVNTLMQKIQVVYISFCCILANLILENIDESVDPCEDFYQFSCGSFITNKRIQDDQSKIDELTILRDRLAYKVAGDYK